MFKQSRKDHIKEQEGAVNPKSKNFLKLFGKGLLTSINKSRRDRGDSDMEHYEDEWVEVLLVVRYNLKIYLKAESNSFITGQQLIQWCERQLKSNSELQRTALRFYNFSGNESESELNSLIDTNVAKWLATELFSREMIGHVAGYVTNLEDGMKHIFHALPLHEDLVARHCKRMEEESKAASEFNEEVDFTLLESLIPGQTPRQDRDQPDFQFERLHIHVLTWNMGECEPPRQTEYSKCIPQGYDVYAICLQECMRLQRMSRQLHKYLGTDIYRAFSHSIGSTRTQLGFHGMIAILVFVKESLLSRGIIEQTDVLRGKKRADVKRGPKLIGSHRAPNKGAAALAFRFLDTSLVFISAHLNSDLKGVDRKTMRDEDVRGILTELGLAKSTENTQSKSAEQIEERSRRNSTAGIVGSLELSHDHGYVFFCGDLNYRINIAPEEALQLVRSAVDERDDSKWWYLNSRDQLAQELRDNGVLNGFVEPIRYFAPTYKRKPGVKTRPVHLTQGNLHIADSFQVSVQENSGEESLITARAPSYTDRVLYSIKPQLQDKIEWSHYYAAEGFYSQSDHLPVCASFLVKEMKAIVTPWQRISGNVPPHFLSNQSLRPKSFEQYNANIASAHKSADISTDSTSQTGKIRRKLSIIIGKTDSNKSIPQESTDSKRNSPWLHATGNIGSRSLMYYKAPYLTQLPFFDALRSYVSDQANLEQFSKYFEFKQVPVGVSVFREGDLGDDGFYIVLKGSLQVTRNQQGNDEAFSLSNCSDWFRTDLLCLADMFVRPDLIVARAQWDVVRGIVRSNSRKNDRGKLSTARISLSSRQSRSGSLLANEMGVIREEDLAYWQIQMFIGHEDGDEQHLLAHFIKQEMESTSELGTLFRANGCIANHLIRAFLQVVGKGYIRDALGTVVTDLCIQCESVNELSVSTNGIDPLQETMDCFLDAIIDSLVFCPISIRKLCNTLYTTAIQRFASEESGYIAVISWIFLRFFCPAILSPQSVGLLEEVPSKSAWDALKLVVKALQAVANGKMLRESSFQPLNSWIESRQSSIKAFCHGITEISATPLISEGKSPEEAQVALVSDKQWQTALVALYSFSYHRRSVIIHCVDALGKEQSGLRKQSESTTSRTANLSVTGSIIGSSFADDAGDSKSEYVISRQLSKSISEKKIPAERYHHRKVKTLAVSSNDDSAINDVRHGINAKLLVHQLAPKNSEKSQRLSGEWGMALDSSLAIPLSPPMFLPHTSSVAYKQDKVAWCPTTLESFQMNILAEQFDTLLGKLGPPPEHLQQVLDSREVLLSTLGLGDWFGEIALFSSTIRTATVTATSPSHLFSLSPERLQVCLKSFPSLREPITRLVHQRTANTLKSVPFFRQIIQQADETGSIHQLDQRLDLLGELFRFKQLRANETLFREGDESDGFYIIVAGKIKITQQVDPLTESESRQRDRRSRTDSRSDKEDVLPSLVKQKSISETMETLIELEEVGESNEVRNKNTDETKVEFEASTESNHEDTENPPQTSNVGQLKANQRLRLSSTGGVGEKTLSVLQAGQWFGEIALVNRSKRTATATAMESTLLLYLTADDWENFLRVVPEFQEIVQSELQNRVVNTLMSVHKFSDLIEHDVATKLAKIAPFFSFVNASTGCVLIRAGDKINSDDGLFLIVSGQVRIFPFGSNVKNEAESIAVLNSGDWVGEVSILTIPVVYQSHLKELNGKGKEESFKAPMQDILASRQLPALPRSCTAVAYHPCVLLKLSYKGLIELSQIAPELVSSLEKETQSRLKRDMSRFKSFINSSLD